MEIREALRDWLETSPGVTALVGTRIFPNKLPQGSAYPQVTFFKVSGPKVRNLSGPDGLVYPRLQIDCWGLTLQSAKDVAEAVRLSTGGVTGASRLDGFRGEIGGQGGVTVQNTVFEDERDSYDAPQDASDVGVHRVSQDVIFWWNEG